MLTIHRTRQPDKLIRIGHAPVILQPEPKREPVTEQAEAPPEPIKSKRGRKKMAEEKKLGQETGVKKISEEPADKQGPVGTGGEKAPASPGEDLTIGKQEGEKDG